jgi:hypothetical protein
VCEIVNAKFLGCIPAASSDGGSDGGAIDAAGD